MIELFLSACLTFTGDYCIRMHGRAVSLYRHGRTTVAMEQHDGRTRWQYTCGYESSRDDFECVLDNPPELPDPRRR